MTSRRGRGVLSPDVSSGRSYANVILPQVDVSLEERVFLNWWHLHAAGPLMIHPQLKHHLWADRPLMKKLLKAELTSSIFGYSGCFWPPDIKNKKKHKQTKKVVSSAAEKWVRSVLPIFKSNTYIERRFKSRALQGKY